MAGWLSNHAEFLTAVLVVLAFFTIATWDAYAPAGFPADANLATPEQQIEVGRLVLAGGGVKSWPICGPRVGLKVGD